MEELFDTTRVIWKDGEERQSTDLGDFVWVTRFGADHDELRVDAVVAEFVGHDLQRSNVCKSRSGHKYRCVSGAQERAGLGGRDSADVENEISGARPTEETMFERGNRRANLVAG